MSYKVIYPFLDAKDGNHLYEVGERYPRLAMEGEISAARFAELASDKNLLKRPLIAQEGEVQPKKEMPKKKVSTPKVEIPQEKEEDAPVEESPVEETPKDEKPEETDISKMPYFKLKSLAKQHGIDIAGKGTAELREELSKVM